MIFHKLSLDAPGMLIVLQSICQLIFYPVTVEEWFCGGLNDSDSIASAREADDLIIWLLNPRRINLQHLWDTVSAADDFCSTWFWRVFSEWIWCEERLIDDRCQNIREKGRESWGFPLDLMGLKACAAGEQTQHMDLISLIIFTETDSEYQSLGFSQKKILLRHSCPSGERLTSGSRILVVEMTK